ncbi:Adenine phosphoribosyltransferase [Arsenophonus endosymbiont of Bemisia tabaci Q2]|nr:Adenine phosphoribosyltransferase [Arsenophonus endosymbiont of Bemisia tabaci Q2]
MFRDITTLLDNPDAYQATIDLLVEHYKNKSITKIVGTEARGFLFGAPVALRLGVGFVPIHKEGKLPRATLRQKYELEYGMDALKIHQDSILAKDNVLVVDNLLARSGTIEATVRLIRQLGGKVNEAAFIICLPDLGGIERLKKQGFNCFNFVEFPGS